MDDTQDDLKIYVVTKNAAVFPQSRIFQAIQGGRVLSQAIPGAIGDDTGDSVSHLNEYYAEMSSMYWVWKNAKPTQYVGFFHYRRFLNFGPPLAPEAHWSERNFFDFEEETIERFGWTRKAILDAIDDADLVLPSIETVARPPTWDSECSIYTHYRNSHMARDINLALAILAEQNPDDEDLANEVMERQKGYFCHMFLMRWELFDEYMTWLFGITEAMRKEIDFDAPIYAMSTGQTRVLGFVGERFFNIFIEKAVRRGHRIKEFERLFGIFPPEWSVDLIPRRATPKKRINTFHRGISVDLFGKRLSFLERD